MRPVAWLPNQGGDSVMVTNVNGVAERLTTLSHMLEAFPESMIRYLVPSAGTFNCRRIAGTDRLSMHAFGAAIDLNPRFGDYWLWSRENGTIIWRNRFPVEIVYPDTLEAQSKALDFITAAADKICNIVKLAGHYQTIKVTGDAKAQLSGLIKQLADLGISRAADFNADEYEGVLRTDLAATVQHNAECKLRVFEKLESKMIK